MRIRHWMLKAALQGAISRLPRSQAWNAILQRLKSRSESADTQFKRFERTVAHCRWHLERYFAVRASSLSGFSALELGTGWRPIAPIVLFLCGASKVLTVDIQPLLTRDALRSELSLFLRYSEAGKLQEMLPWVDKCRLGLLLDLSLRSESMPLRQMLESIQVQLMIGDSRHMADTSGSVDLFISNNTLEHIPTEVIPAIFREFKRLGSKQAVMSHHIVFADEYAVFDSFITPYNCMKFSERWWRLFNNSLFYQNRLRPSDYRQIHNNTGWPIVGEEIVAGSVSDLRKVPLAAEFRRYSQEDLLALDWYVMSQSS